MSTLGRVTPGQRRAIAALLTSPDNRSAARAANVSERQLYRWLALPEFKAELQDSSRQAVDLVIRRMAELIGQAVQTLAEIMNDRSTNKGTRVQAANILLSRLMELREAHDFEDRMQRIEKELKL